MMTSGTIIRGTLHLIRAEWRAVLIWSAVNLALSFAMRLVLGQQLRAQIDSSAGPPPVAWLLLYVLVVAAVVMLYTAVFRAALQPQERRAAFLRIGMDELRIIGLFLLLYLGFVIALIPLILVVALLGVLLGIGTNAGGLVLTVAFGIALVFVAVRLSLAAPLTILRRRITIRPAWRLSKGHFWILFGAYGSASLALGVISLPILFAMLGQDATALAEPQSPEAAQRMLDRMTLSLDPVQLMGQAVGGLFGGIFVGVFGGMPAVATAQLLARADDAERIYDERDGQETG